MTNTLTALLLAPVLVILFGSGQAEIIRIAYSSPYSEFTKSNSYMTGFGTHLTRTTGQGLGPSPKAASKGISGTAAFTVVIRWSGAATLGDRVCVTPVSYHQFPDSYPHPSPNPNPNPKS